MTRICQVNPHGTSCSFAGLQIRSRCWESSADETSRGLPYLFCVCILCPPFTTTPNRQGCGEDTPRIGEQRSGFDAQTAHLPKYKHRIRVSPRFVSPTATISEDVPFVPFALPSRFVLAFVNSLGVRRRKSCVVDIQGILCLASCADLLAPGSESNDNPSRRTGPAACPLGRRSINPPPSPPSSS